MIVLFIFVVFTATAESKECPETRCNRDGPSIRFPFRVEGIQPQHCGYSRDFDITCTKENQTLLHLPISANFIVNKIDYKSQVVHLSDPQNCLLQRLYKNVNLSSSAFQYYKKTARKIYTLISCSSEIDDRHHHDHIKTPISSCLSYRNSGDKVYAVLSSSFVNDTELVSCSKMFEIDYLSYDVMVGKKNEILLSWSTPNCSECKARGLRCGLKPNSTESIIECYSSPLHDARRKLVISAAVMGPFLLVLVAVSMNSFHQKNKSMEENQAKIEKFLADYESFKPTRYSYADIKKITNQFSDELGQGAYGTVYKGKLSDEILVAVKVLKSSKGRGEEFINEVGIIGKIHHVNVVRLVGFCADGFRRALVYEFLPNGSLQKFISLPIRNERSLLSWDKMKDIALGVAKGIEYLHQGCDQRILHFDIKPHNVLLDRNFTPKISDFGTAKLCSKDHSVVSMSTARGTMGYIAPEVFSRNFGDASHKSDVYSFGMMLLEMVGSRRRNGNDTSQIYLPEWIYGHLEQGKDLDLDFEIDEENDSKILKRLATVGVRCIQWLPMDRPSMSIVVKMLDGSKEIDLPSNPFAKGPAPRKLVQQELAVINELE